MFTRLLVGHGPYVLTCAILHMKRLTRATMARRTDGFLTSRIAWVWLGGPKYLGWRRSVMGRVGGHVRAKCSKCDNLAQDQIVWGHGLSERRSRSLESMGAPSGVDGQRLAGVRQGSAWGVMHSVSVQWRITRLRKRLRRSCMACLMERGGPLKAS